MLQGSQGSSQHNILEQKLELHGAERRWIGLLTAARDGKGFATLVTPSREPSSPSSTFFVMTAALVSYRFYFSMFALLQGQHTTMAFLV